MAYSVLRTDAMSGTIDGSKLKSFVYGEDIENGRVVLLGSLSTKSREIFTATTPASNSNLADCVLVAGVETSYDERKQNPEDFINKAGVATRGYDFVAGNIFSVTTDALDGTAAKDSIIELQADEKLKVVETATAGSTIVGKVIGVETVGTRTYAVIKVGTGEKGATVATQTTPDNEG